MDHLLCMVEDAIAASGGRWNVAEVLNGDDEEGCHDNAEATSLEYWHGR